jgi:hypothetical protein
LVRFVAAAIAVAVIAVARTAAADAVRGTVVDRTTGQPVAGAVVTLGSELVVTDDAGRFRVDLAARRYTATVTGGWTATQVIDLRGDVAITIRASGETIDVVDIKPSNLGETSVDAATARTLPGGAGDAAKIIQSMPAVARPPAGSTEIVVWGAAPNETRVFVDGVPVPALYHIGGYRSAIGSELIG